MKRLLFLFCLLNLACAFSVSAKDLVTDPGKLVQTTVLQVRETVKSKKSAIPLEELDRLLEAQIRPVFSFNEMSKQSLGIHWTKGTSAEQDEFVNLFSNLLARTYLAKIRDIDQTEMEMASESIDEEKAIVKTIATSKGEDFSIDYRLRKENGAWRVYDVIVENVSIISTYRSEFGEEIRKNQFSGLISKLRDKIEKKQTS
ncbi:ABC transporter substrate-binding protein [bacterium]|nr:ABC transporter substrate-binding protein [bacterium]